MDRDSPIHLFSRIVDDRRIVAGNRYLRRAGDRAYADRLVLVLHIAYAFVPIGFLLLGAAILGPRYLADQCQSSTAGQPAQLA